MTLFKPKKLGPIEIKNAMVMAPMCMRACINHDGIASSFHVAHYGARAIGQVGLIIVESTAVLPEGRIDNEDLGLYNETQMESLKPVVEACQYQGSKIAVQLGHAGRKSRVEHSVPKSPTNIAFSARYQKPIEMDLAAIKEVLEAFKMAAVRADQAGFDGIEIHGAHGYLIHQFLSPITNQRTDQYGADRSLFLREVLEAVRSVWPKEKALWLRVSSNEYDAQGYNIHQLIQLLKPIIPLVDAIHVSSGGNSPKQKEIREYPGYILEDAKWIKNKLKVPVIGVGLIQTPPIAKSSFEKYPIDFIAVGRTLLSDPNFYLHCCMYYDRQDLIFDRYKRAFKNGRT